MADLNSLKRNLERLKSNSNFHIQSQGVGLLIAQVHDFVRGIAEEEAAVKQIPELERIARSKAENEQDEQKIEEAKRALMLAEDVRRSISSKKASLRQLENSVQELLNEIRKAT